MANKEKIDDLQNLIKDRIDGKLVEQQVKSLLPPGENFGSVMYKVDFKVKNQNQIEEYHAVAKCTPLNPVTQEAFNIQDTFKAEIAWYTTVIPTLKEFANEQGLKKEIDFFQKFYGARISLDPTSNRVDLDGVILTENLTYLGYKNIDRHAGFDLPTTYTILKKLATFHAVPLAIQIKNPKLFEEKIKPYLPRFGDFSKDMQESFNKQFFSVFEEIPECQPIMERIKKAINEAKVFNDRALREPWTTVIHMDFWTNNIMITDNKDPKIIILDLQVPCLGSPAADLVFCLLTSINLTIVKEKIDDFVKFYYNEFISNLSQLNVSIEPYTFEGLLKEIATEVRTGEFAHSISHSFMIMQEKGARDFDSSDENFKVEEMKLPPANEKQKEKYRWIACEAAKRNWI